MPGQLKRSHRVHVKSPSVLTGARHDTERGEINPLTQNKSPSGLFSVSASDTKAIDLNPLSARKVFLTGSLLTNVRGV